MKRRDRILQTVTLAIGLCGLGFYTVRQGSPFLITLLISLGTVLLYAYLSEISEGACTKLMAMPYVSHPHYGALIALSIRIALPLYLCLLCAACIPLFRWEMFLLTGLPILILLAVPLYSVMEELHDRRLPRPLFLTMHLSMILCIYAAGQLIGAGLAQLLIR